MTMQTFSANFCRCVISETASPGSNGNHFIAGMPQGRKPEHHSDSVLAISGSEPSEIELWSLKVLNSSLQIHIIFDVQILSSWETG